MSGKIEISRELAERLIKGDASKGANALQLVDAWKAMDELRVLLAAPVVERQPTGQWRISVNGDWFYGTKEQCERERAEYETTFTAEDYAEAGVVVPEQIWSSPPAPVAVLLPEPMEMATPGADKAPVEIHNSIVTGWNACLDKVKELNQ